MGAKIVEYFTLAKEKGGVSTAVKLAMKTCITSATAQATPDTPDNIMKIKKVLQELLPNEKFS